tara:strand:+ start:387 stop:542 length:156 start_codon:yes stop_codon:yes gene_type:complete
MRKKMMKKMKMKMRKKMRKKEDNRRKWNLIPQMRMELVFYLRPLRSSPAGR